MMTLMPRREFLQAGAGAAWAIAHPAWATWSGTVNATLDLDTPLKEYLADEAPTGRWSEKITSRHVLSHSSGLPNWRWDKDQELTPAFSREIRKK